MFNYQSYGAFKRTTGKATNARSHRLLRTLGIRHRYLRFLDPAPRDAPLLEIGCGDGAFLRELEAAGFVHVLGVEPSQSYEPVVAAHLIVRGYAQDHLKQVSAGTLGTVIALDVFEHIPVDDLRQLLITIEHCLRPGGTLLIRIPNMASPLGMLNYFGDVSHTSALNEVSVSQLAFDSAFTNVRFHAEPFAYPRSIASLAGILLWLPYRLIASALLAAFGIKASVLTPNLLCVMTKSAATRTTA